MKETRYILTLAVLALLAPATQATSPPPSLVPAGFINADEPAAGMPKPVQRLPANAKGALFLLRTPDSLWLRSIGGEHVILSELPQPPAGSEFDVLEDSRPLGHAQIVAHLPIDRRADDMASPRYWIASEQKTPRPLRQCLGGQSAEVCLGLSARTRQSPQAVAQVLHRRFREVTSEVRQREGLFRIAPIGGFKPGRSYTIRFLGRENLPGLLHPHEIHVAIGKEILRPWATGFRLVQHGPLQYFEAGSAGGWARTLKYIVPPDYERYRANLLYIARQFETPQPAAVSSWGRNPLVSQFLWEHRPPRGMERYSPPGLHPGDYGTIGVAGFVGMLEVEDELHATPPLIVEFRHPKGKPSMP